MDPGSSNHEEAMVFDPRTLRYVPKKPAAEPAIITRQVTGTIPTRIEEARRKQDTLLEPGDPGLHWGSLRLPSWPLPNFLILGLVGMGKTTIVRLLSQNLLPNVGNRLARHPARCLVYDPKRDLLPHIISQHSDPDLVVITNPLDERSRPWDLAQDFASPTYAEELAKLIVPLQAAERDANDAFYPKVVRIILQGVFQALIKIRPGKWTLRDAILATEYADDLKNLLKQAVPHTQHALQELGSVKDTYGNLMISVFEKFHPYRILASLWHKSQKPPFTLTAWIRSPHTLLLGLVNDQRELLINLNQLLFNRAAHLLLSQPEYPTTASYVIMDELGRAEQLRELPHLLAEGRSRSISVILASQGIEMLKHNFSELPLEDLLSHCRNRAYLGLSPTTARWAAEQIGKAEFVEEIRSVGTSTRPGEPSNNRTLQRHERYAIRPEVFMNRAQPSLKSNSPLCGTFSSDPGSAYGIVAQDEIPLEVMFNELLKPSHDHRDFIPVDTSHQELEPWTAEERLQLGLSAQPPSGRGDPFDNFMGYDFPPPG